MINVVTVSRNTNKLQRIECIKAMRGIMNASIRDAKNIVDQVIGGKVVEATTSQRYTCDFDRFMQIGKDGGIDIYFLHDSASPALYEIAEQLQEIVTHAVLANETMLADKLTHILQHYLPKKEQEKT